LAAPGPSRRRHVEHGVPALVARDLHDHAAGLHDLARLGAAGGDTAVTSLTSSV
jgi:hypothetical protein